MPNRKFLKYFTARYFQQMNKYNREFDWEAISTKGIDDKYTKHWGFNGVYSLADIKVVKSFTSIFDIAKLIGIKPKKKK